MDNDISNYVVVHAWMVERFHCNNCKGEITSTAKIHKPTKKIYCGDCIRQHVTKK